MEAYLQKVKEMVKNFKTIMFILILPLENRKAEALAWLAAAQTDQVPRTVHIKLLKERV